MNRPGALLFAASALLCIFSPTRPAAALENARVAYPSATSAAVLSLRIAQKEGYYREEALNVELLSIRGEIAIRTALAGEIDFFTNIGSALAAAVRGVPVKIIAVFQDRPSWDLIAQPNINSIAQLRGATIGVMSPEGSLAVVTREILQRHGIDPAKDANLIVMGGDDVRLMALRGKAIQATLMNPGTSFVARKEGFVKLAASGDYVNFVSGGLATTDERIKQSPAKIQRFVRASLKGVSYYAKQRDATIRFMMETLKIPDRELAGAVYEAELGILVPGGSIEDKVAQALIDGMRKTTKIQRPIKASEVFDFTFVKRAREEPK
jgi:ABC-type nitrate/sulfonate/bicarbonate transport system substrate-binding protein